MDQEVVKLTEGEIGQEEIDLIDAEEEGRAEIDLIDAEGEGRAEIDPEAEEIADRVITRNKKQTNNVCIFCYLIDEKSGGRVDVNAKES